MGGKCILRSSIAGIMDEADRKLPERMIGVLTSLIKTEFGDAMEFLELSKNTLL